ncbi:Long chain acyl-CoA synthetase 7 peroxisomal [Kappamyces sp. JEL0680]|nr:Long chain acyl-CoA synthetase 7 peroxisomal [Kappamyces sp. JEL0680]
MQKCSIGVVVASADKVDLLMKLAPSLPSLTTIILMEPLPDNSLLPSEAADRKIRLLNLDELERTARQNPIVPQVPCTMDTVATISFTSGTTSIPKGVVLSHKNLLSFLTGALGQYAMGRSRKLKQSDSHLSYLPLAHIMERTYQVTLVYFGCRIGFYQGNPLTIVDDLQALRPTTFASVPRLFNKVYDTILDTLKTTGGLKYRLFCLGYRVKQRRMKTTGLVTHWFWDKLLFHRIAARLGGNIEFIVSGAAPLSVEVLDFFRICFSAQFIEGYGQTEASGGNTVGWSSDLEGGHVGAPLVNSMCKLRDVPHMNYHSTDRPFPRGEICLKGSGVFQGYYKEPEKTKETLSEDGWCYTGDIGYWDHCGRLRIIDRVKNIFKLSQGEYVAPEKIEMVLAKHDCVAQVIVYGETIRDCLVAVVVLDAASFQTWAASRGLLSNSTVAGLVQDPSWKPVLVQDLEEHALRAGLQAFECIRAVHLAQEPFSVENGLLTPTFKPKRQDIAKKYQSELAALYSELNAS